MRLTTVLSAIALSASLAHAQQRDVRGHVFITEDGDVMLEENRSNVFQIIDETWARHLRAAEGETVDARIDVVTPGPFGGTARIVSLVRDVKGEVQLPAGGAPIISANRSNAFQVRGGPWERFLMNMVGETVEARLRIVKPGPFGGEAEVVSLVREVTGDVSDGALITVNRSNLLQVVNEPFRTLLLSSSGRRVTARVRVVEPGMFGGYVDVLSLRGAHGPRLRVRARPSPLAPVMRTVASRGELEVTGATPRWLEVRLRDGRTGFVPRDALELGAPVRGLADLLPR
jgi:hypothetical protein